MILIISHPILSFLSYPTYLSIFISPSRIGHWLDCDTGIPDPDLINDVELGGRS